MTWGMEGGKLVWQVPPRWIVAICAKHGPEIIGYWKKNGMARIYPGPNCMQCVMEDAPPDVLGCGRPS